MWRTTLRGSGADGETRTLRAPSGIGISRWSEQGYRSANVTVHPVVSKQGQQTVLAALCRAGLFLCGKTSYWQDVLLMEPRADRAHSV